MKRTDYISWDEYFMGIALLSAMRSKDSNSQVGACIVSPENKILSLGYNGMPTGCSDDEMPWDREGPPLETKYMYVCHAELNAILNSAHSDLRGARVYVTLFPCNECAKSIIQSGIKEIVGQIPQCGHEHRQPPSAGHGRRQVPGVPAHRARDPLYCMTQEKDVEDG